VYFLGRVVGKADTAFWEANRFLTEQCGSQFHYYHLANSLQSDTVLLSADVIQKGFISSLSSSDCKVFLLSYPLSSWRCVAEYNNLAPKAHPPPNYNNHQ
jgi:hypothetical protein